MHFIRTTVLLLLFLSLCGLSVKAQLRSLDKKTLISSAGHHAQDGDYKTALAIYILLDSLQPGTPEVIFNIGVCTYQYGDKPASLLYFLKAYQAGYHEKEILYYLGKSYQFNYDLDHALLYLQQYHEKLDTLQSEEKKQYKELNLEISQIENSRKILDRKLSVSIESLGDIINSSAPDYVPISYGHDSVLVFTSRRTGSVGGKLARDGWHHEDVYMSVRGDSGKWTAPKHIPGFNDKHHDAGVAISPDESVLFIYKARNNGDIYFTTRNARGKWIKPVPFKVINSPYWEGSIAMSPSGDSLFFSSDRPGGYGGSDLYMTIKDKQGNWGTIQNMGPEINTELDDDAPYMYKDGKAFFFSSKGHQAIGGYDVFSIRLLSQGQWGELKNIGFPINTIDDDIYFQLNSSASIGYFTSHRHSNFEHKSIGEKDIFQIKRPYSSPAYFVFKGLLHNSANPEIIPAVVRLKDLSNPAAPEQKIAADFNSGTFRFDLRFENRYELTVEIGDKVYLSRELFFSYRPEMFETFSDIEVSDIPRYQVKLQDVLANLPDTLHRQVLSDQMNQTVTLVRKVPFNDSSLKQLLESDRIPVSFRKKLQKQLEAGNYLDRPEEGALSKTMFDDLPPEPEALITGPAKLEATSSTEIKKTDIKNSLKEPAANDPAKDSTTWNGLSEYEQKLIMRLAETAVSSDSSQHFTIDDVYYRNLKPEEEDLFMRMLVVKARQLFKSSGANDLNAFESRLLSVADDFRTKVFQPKTAVKLFNKEAWGILYTIETSGFNPTSAQRINFEGTVHWRSNMKPAQDKKLLLADDRGVIYTTTNTGLNGEVTFNDLQAGRRYHILIDDYAIAMLGQSRYQMIVQNQQINTGDYLKFYDSLSSVERRSVDRFIARQLLLSDYQENPVHEPEDGINLNKLSLSEKDFIKRLQRYLNASAMTEPDAFMDNRDRYKYEQLTAEDREEYNRYIALQTSVTFSDSVFLNKLTGKQKHFIDQLQGQRKARKVILEDILISQSDSEFWYQVGQINTTIAGKPDYVTVYGTLLNKSKGRVNQLEVALMDEFNQIRFTTLTDSTGNFILLHALAGKKYKVLIKRGDNIDKIDDYQLVNVHIENGEADFYESLSPTQKRRIDRIIATNLAKEAFMKNAALQVNDKTIYETLSGEEKQFLERLQKHIFADSVTPVNSLLKPEDNHRYYMNLSLSEREFINREIIRQRYDTMALPDFALLDKDRIFYNSLTAQQKEQVAERQRERKSRAIIFAENPQLIVEKNWVLLDTIAHQNRMADNLISIRAKVIDIASGQGKSFMPVMLTDTKNQVISIVTTDSSGFFYFKNIKASEAANLLVETKRSLFIANNLAIDSLTIDPPLNTQQPTRINLFTVHFDFNSYQLTTAARIQLKKWLVNWNAGKDAGTIYIAGHTDAIGQASYNDLLAAKRSKEVKKFLVQLGVPGERLKVDSYGEQKIRYFDNHDQHLNRRVEISQSNEQ